MATWEKCLSLPGKTEVCKHYDAVIPLLHLKDMLAYVCDDSHLKMLMAILLVITNFLKEPTCPSLIELI